MQDLKTKVKYEMTEERAQHWTDTCEKLVMWLEEYFPNDPREAYAFLTQATNFLGDKLGVTYIGDLKQ